jgi:hypothetical protein
MQFFAMIGELEEAQIAAPEVAELPLKLQFIAAMERL